MLDLSADFDTAFGARAILAALTDTFNIKSDVGQCINSYLSDRTMQVCIVGTYSDPVTIDCSLPTGFNMESKR